MIVDAFAPGDVVVSEGAEVDRFIKGAVMVSRSVVVAEFEPPVVTSGTGILVILLIINFI